MYSYIKQGALKNALIFSTLATMFTATVASSVVPPPLPIGSHMVKQHAGMNPHEVERNKRAHHHNKHHKKDITRDDTIDAAPEDSDPKQGSGNHMSRPKSK